MKQKDFEWLKEWLKKLLYDTRDTEDWEYAVGRATEECPPPIDEEEL